MQSMISSVFSQGASEVICLHSMIDHDLTFFFSLSDLRSCSNILFDASFGARLNARLNSSFEGLLVGSLPLAEKSY